MKQEQIVCLTGLVVQQAIIAKVLISENKVVLLNKLATQQKVVLRKKADIATQCANGGGTIVTATSGTFCMSNDTMSWYDAEEWCRNNGMIMLTMKEMCPSSWNAVFIECSELEIGLYVNTVVWSSSVTPNNSDLMVVLRIS